jgi:hypothetical protein
MPRIEVETGQLQVAGGRQGALGEHIASLCGTVVAAGDAASGAAGDPRAAGAIADCAGAWSVSLQMLSQSVGGLAANLGSAGAAYEGTDAGVIPGAAR